MSDLIKTILTLTDKNTKEEQKKGNILDIIFKDAKNDLLNKAPLILCGYGAFAKEIKEWLNFLGINTIGFIDDRADIQSEGIHQYKVESALQNHPDAYFIISSRIQAEDIFEKLKTNGIPESKILLTPETWKKFGKYICYYILNHLVGYFSRNTDNEISAYKETIINDRELVEEAYGYLSDTQSKDIFVHKLALLLSNTPFHAFCNFLGSYSDSVIENEALHGTAYYGPLGSPEFEYYFRQNFLKLANEEVYLDGGAADGDTIIPFVDICKKNGLSYKEIHAFEPDPESFEKLSANMKNIRDVFCERKGLWSERKTFKFTPLSGHKCGSISDNGEISIQAISIDEYLKGKQLTLVKLDPGGNIIIPILEGMRHTAIQHKPKIIAGAYHAFDSIYKIPLILKSLRPDYKIYLRHLAYHTNETHAFTI